MGDVIQFVKKGLVSGEIKCINCQHIHVGVAEVGTTDLECPNCHLMKARFNYRFSANITLMCDCGCDDYFIWKNSLESTEVFISCRSCGALCNPFE